MSATTVCLSDSARKAAAAARSTAPRSNGPLLTGSWSAPAREPRSSCSTSRPSQPARSAIVCTASRRSASPSWSHRLASVLAKPCTTVIGVRSSWLVVARNRRRSTPRTAMSKPRYPTAPSNRQLGLNSDRHAASIPAETSTSQLGQRRSSERRRTTGNASVAKVAPTPSRIGAPANSSVSRPPNASPHSSTPPPIRPTMFVPLVRKNSALELSTILSVDIPASRSSHPPIARAPRPPVGSSAPEPSSVHATRRARSAGTLREEQAENHHIGGTGRDLEHHGNPDPSEAHTRYLLADPA